MSESFVYPPDSFDEPWKAALTAYFPEFLELCFPAVHAVVDWSVEPEFLDKELDQIEPASGRGSLGVDKLVRLKLRSGETACLLAHVEVQAQTLAEFPKRMWVYHYRIFDKLGIHAEELAVLADEMEGWMPASYESNRIVSGLRLDYAIFKVSAMHDPEAVFTRTGNVFALVLAANNAAHRTKRDGATRMTILIRMIRVMIERGIGMRETFAILRVLQWLLKMPEGIELQYRDERNRLLKQGGNMKLEELELIEERLARAEGKLEGELNKAREDVLEVLEVRFGEIPYLLAERVRHLESMELLHQLHRRAVMVESLEVFERELPVAS